MSLFVLAAGGTGGHMVPAHATAQALRERGHKVALITDARGARFPGLFEGVDVRIMPAGRLAGGVFGLLRAIRDVARGRRMAALLYKEARPAAVVGFGGYPALPALLAATARAIPTAIHEQNAILGRTNRLLAGRVDAIATSYPHVGRLKPAHADKTELTGNPVRDDVLRLRDAPAPVLGEGAVEILVTGGSQGATVLSTVVPEGLALLDIRDRLKVVHQARPEDADAARARYAAHGIAAEVATYLPNMPARLAVAHLVIARAGASTIAELTAAGRASILVPLPTATDDHQTANARALTDAGGGVAIRQDQFTPDALAAAVHRLTATPDTLAEAAALARAAGLPDAAERLADLVERIARIPAAPIPATPAPVAQLKEALA